MNFHQFLENEGKKRTRDKGEHIFRQGDSDKSLYFVKSGLLKAYYVSDMGKESIKSFISPNNIIGSLTSAYSEIACSFSLICLEPTTLIEIPFLKLREHSLKNHELANDIIEFLLHFSMKKEKREFELLCLSAEKRFTMLLETSPSLLEKVTQNDIARYLGITPVALSRIKKRLNKEL